MADAMEMNVGQRIKMFRVRQGFSLRSLAEKAGLSANTISLIERGENSPNVSSLHRLAEALEVPITAFFQDETEQLTVFVKHNKGTHYQSDGMVVESMGTGLLNQQLEAMAILVESGAGNVDDPITHQGEEFVRCLEGLIEYRVAAQAYRMGPGDSLLFDATQPHSFRNTSPKPATILTVFLAGEEQHLARQQHQEI
jgi:transcriptional regulator with XRE-family HTH domain